VTLAELAADIRHDVTRRDYWRALYLAVRDTEDDELRGEYYALRNRERFATMLTRSAFADARRKSR
jgi:hypothetical protein